MATRRRHRRTTTANQPSDQFLVKIASLGEAVREYLAQQGNTIATVLSSADISSAGDITLNGEQATLDTVVHENDLIVVTPRIKGGN